MRVAVVVPAQRFEHIFEPRGVAGKRHRLISHNAKYIRQNRGTTVLSEADTRTVKLWAPYGLG